MSTPILDFAGLFPVSEMVRITRFDITNRSDLAQVPTTRLSTGSVFDVITGSGTSRVSAEVELQAGTANLADQAQIAPNDDPTRHWQVVGGLLP